MGHTSKMDMTAPGFENYMYPRCILYLPTHLLHSVLVSVKTLLKTSDKSDGLTDLAFDERMPSLK